jgi:hypothetical protein
MRHDDPIAVSVRQGSVATAETREPRNSQAPLGPEVPWLDFSRAICRLAQEKQWNPSFRDPTSRECHNYAVQLRSLNGEFPCSWEFVSEFDEYARLYDGKRPEFERIIRAEYDKL